MRWGHYPHLLQAISAVLQWPGLLQWWTDLSINGLLLFIQVTNDLIQTRHHLAALLFLLV